MGLSSNQARFLSLTSRQVDLEHRIQQICQRRLRLSSELENVATSYNNSISNRKMFTQSPAQLQSLSTQNLAPLGYNVINTNTHKIVKGQQATTTSGFTPINTQADFINLVTNLNNGTASSSGKYMLNCDIDLSTTPLTNSLIQNTFTGTFDGNGHTINGLTINATTSNIGMFSSVSGAILENIVLKSVNINSTAGGVGGLAGKIGSGTNISNCFVSGAVAGGDNIVGGVVGDTNASTISNVTSDVNVTGTGDRVGGISGCAFSGSLVENSTSSGNITSTASSWGVGGIVGDLNGSTINGCSSSANVKGLSNAGGIVGLNCGSITENSFSTGTVTGTSAGNNYSGGVVGREMSGGQVANCYTTANVIGGQSTSGFIGSFDSPPNSCNNATG